MTPSGPRRQSPRLSQVSREKEVKRPAHRVPPTLRLPGPPPCTSPREKPFLAPSQGRRGLLSAGRRRRGQGHCTAYSSAAAEGTLQTPRLGTSGKGSRPRPLGVRAKEAGRPPWPCTLGSPRPGRATTTCCHLAAIRPAGPQPADPPYLSAPPLRGAAVSQANMRNANRRRRGPFGLARTP